MACDDLLLKIHPPDLMSDVTNRQMRSTHAVFAVFYVVIKFFSVKPLHVSQTVRSETKNLWDQQGIDCSVECIARRCSEKQDVVHSVKEEGKLCLSIDLLVQLIRRVAERF